MKQCPVCSRTYFDDGIAYCLSDGTLLTDTGTAGETATFVRPAEDPTVVSRHAGAAPVAGKSSGGLKVAIVGLLGVVLLLILVVVVLVGVMWMRGRQETANTSSNGNANQVTLLPGASPSPDAYRSTPVSSPTGTAIASSTPPPPPTPRPTPSPDQRLADIPGQGRTFTDPGTSRLQFRRGSVGETFRGTVSRQRSFVLRTLYGQYLTAVVRSTGNCVIFREASSEIAFTTGQGDTSLTVVNRCPQPQDFTMTVTVR